MDQAGIYLRSPNRGLALFSLAVAFFLDIAAFTVGFLIYLVEEKNKKEQLLRGLSTQRDRGDAAADTGFGIVSPATARRYLYLTGDYIRENERFITKPWMVRTKLKWCWTSQTFSVASTWRMVEHSLPSRPRHWHCTRCRMAPGMVYT